MSFIKKHWLVFLLLALFIYAVYQVDAALQKIAAIALSVASFMLGLPLLFFLIPIWALGFVFGGLPNSLYDWLPRNQAKTGTGFTITQPKK